MVSGLAIAGAWPLTSLVYVSSSAAPSRWSSPRTHRLYRFSSSHARVVNRTCADRRIVRRRPVRAPVRNILVLLWPAIRLYLLSTVGGEI
jgi:hypothetical protein